MESSYSAINIPDFFNEDKKYKDFFTSSDKKSLPLYKCR